MLALLENEEVRKFIKWVLIIFLLLTVLMVVAFNYALESLHRQTVENNIAIMGYIADQHPELEKELVPLFTRGPSEEIRELGEDVAKKYGYTQDLPLAANETFSNYKSIQLNLVLALALISLALFLTAALWFLNKLYRKIRSYANHVENIVEGDLIPIPCEEVEGDIAKLSHGFNKMVKTLSAAQKRQWKEKLLHKNIISDISHQLKTPLSSIKVFNELSMDVECEDAETKVFAVKIEQQVERMEWLVRNLLIMARLETKSLEFKREIKDITKTVTIAMEPLKELWQKKDIKINTDFEDDIYMSHDEKWLAEAVSNIIKNAIEHTPNSGKIAIQTSQSPIAVKIEVKDNGAGITNKDKPHIFERFYKGKYNTQKNSTGIGLSLAKGIVENHQGVINVTTKEGEGSMFTITLFKDKSI
ncbi:HAMP domain-containing sensor histidine kinase [Proteinivorax hydrogeniformans]|uniref:histidine kinase n=1 Tax=Proteinivorax hydrogeniformans TaxID=1826727 RepID=A0AAU8HSA8_9FIRM